MAALEDSRDFMGEGNIAEGDHRESISSDALELFKDIFDSDNALLEGEGDFGAFEIHSEPITGDIHNFESLYRETMLGKMVAHDQEDAESAYLRGALEGLMTHTYLKPKKRAEAGMARVDALFAKDIAETSLEIKGDERDFVDGEATLSNSPFEEDELQSFNPDERYVKNVFRGDIDAIDTNIDGDEFGEWSKVYQSFLREAELTVGEYFEQKLEENESMSQEEIQDISQSYAEAVAYFEMKAYFLNKTQEELDLGLDNNDEDYLQKAWNLKAKAATQKINYPDALRDRNGKGQAGSLANIYCVLVNHHDADRTRIIEETEGWAKDLNRARGGPKDMTTEYSGRQAS